MKDDYQIVVHGRSNCLRPTQKDGERLAQGDLGQSVISLTVQSLTSGYCRVYYIHYGASASGTSLSKALNMMLKLQEMHFFGNEEVSFMDQWTTSDRLTGRSF